MSDLYRWCVGYRRFPHVPNDLPLVATNQGRGARLCGDCYRQWQAEVGEASR